MPKGHVNVGLRRAACDKCRSQKLRCLRDADKTSCRRCEKKGTECAISSVFRMRNYTGDPAATRRGHQQHHTQTEGTHMDTSTATSTGTGTGAGAGAGALAGTGGSNSTSMIPSDDTDTDMGKDNNVYTNMEPEHMALPDSSGSLGAPDSFHMHELSGLESMLMTTFPQLDQAVFPISPDDTFHALNINTKSAVSVSRASMSTATSATTAASASTPSPSTAFNCPPQAAQASVAERLEKWHQTNSSLFNFVMFPQSSAGKNAKPPALQDLGQGTSPPYTTTGTEGEAFSVPSTDFHPGESSFPLLLDTTNLDFDTSTTLGDGFPITLDSSSFVAQATPAASQSVNELETADQKLARLQSRLTELTARLEEAFQDSPDNLYVNGLFRPTCVASQVRRPMIEDVLHNTRSFLDALGSMKVSPFRDPKPPPPTPSNVNQSPAVDTRGRAGKSASPEDAASSSAGDGQILPSHSPSSSSDGLVGIVPGLDFTTQLLVLICYIQILRMFVLLSSCIERYLRQLADSDDPTICPVSGLCFGNVPIQSGNLQTQLFIQIIMSLFGRIENMLGIPRDLRVDIDGRERNETSAHRHFITTLEVAMRKEEGALDDWGRTGPTKKGGGIKALRRNLANIKQLLDDKINP